nr:PilZ domain-containing protein [uncultured Schaedlerella sp.]
MRLFGLFGKGSKEQPKENEQNTEENSHAEITAYSGMRVEVTTFEGELLFVAKLVNLRENQAVLQQYSETERSKEILRQYTEGEDAGAGSSANTAPESLEVVFARMLARQAQEAEQAEKEQDSEEEKQKEPLHVRIRGYNDHERKAVYMEGFITPEEKHTWKVEELTVTRIGNDRAFFRLETNLDAVVTTFGGFSAREQDCKMLNISVGGARILSEQLYHEGDKFLLKVQLLEDRPMSVMFCEVLRVFEREDSKYEYGCRFLELNEEDQDKITQNIFAAQLAERRKKRGQ